MKLRSRLVALLLSILVPVGVCSAATITGTVAGTDGKPFQGAFVEAQNSKSKITVIVLSGSRGEYAIENLPQGEYRVQLRAVGFKAQPIQGVKLQGSQKVTQDFALEKSKIEWRDISLYQATELWPAARGKDIILGRCSSCHAFQSRMASVVRDEEGWRDRVEYMRKSMRISTEFSDDDAAEVASYLTKLFGPNPVLPPSPADMPGFQKTVRQFSGEAMNIVYVEYDMPGPSRMPFSAAPDKNGQVWIPNFGSVNKITRLNPDTGEMQDFTVPHVGTARIHSAIPASDGSVWIAEQQSNKLARWDPVTKEITEFPGPDAEATIVDRYGLRHKEPAQKHTLRLDSKGGVWASGVPLTKFDPVTKKYTRYDDAAFVYDVKPDKGGNVWFTDLIGHTIGKVDAATGKVMKWAPPTPSSLPRRVEVGKDGIIWFGEYNAGKLGRFDPETRKFEEFVLPGPDPSPYGLGVAADGAIWYDSHNQDTIGRFDPKTGKITEYPFPHPEICIREFFPDKQGRMWYGSSPNNKVGYFYLTPKRNGSMVSSN